METRDASPAHLLVKIESFSKLSENGIREYESREFVAGDHKWRLIIYPDGDESGTKSGHISAYLSMVGTGSLPVDWEVNAMFDICLLNHITDKYHSLGGKVRRFHALNTKRGFPKLISKTSFRNPSNGYLVDDKCVFGAEVFVLKIQRLIECVSVWKVATPYKHDLVIPHFSKLEDVWNSEEFTAGGYRWKITVYPKGSAREKDRFVSIFVKSVDAASFAPHEKLKAIICIRLKNKINDKRYIRNVLSHWFSSASSNWGYPEFISIGDLHDPGKGYIVDDCCFLEIETSVKAVVRDAPK